MIDVAKVNTTVVTVDPKTGDRVVLLAGDDVPEGVRVDDAHLSSPVVDEKPARGRSAKSSK